MLNPSTPVLFIHGPWLHRTSWGGWLELFRQRGYTPSAPGWPDEPDTVEEARAHPERVANQSLQTVVDHFKSVATSLSARPILIGHSLGGLIAEKLLGEDIGVAGVAIDSVRIKSVLPLAVVLGNLANISRAVSLTKKEFKVGFGNALSEEESDALWERWTIPSPARPLFEAAVANFNPHAVSMVNTHNDGRGPLLLISGMADRTAPDVTTRYAFHLYRNSISVTQLKTFEGRGHSLVVDHGWRDVAQSVLEWLDAQELTASDYR
jgi:pimeloyl-ACP methyl ester carboxylesterase